MGSLLNRYPSHNQCMKHIIFILMLMFTMNITCGAKSVGTIKEVTEYCVKQTKQHTDSKGVKYDVYRGPRGGYFVIKKVTRGEHKGQYRREYIKGYKA